MYPRKQADIEKMEFETVIQVAEAVEKYQVFAAMKICEMRLKQLIPTHAAEILAHGIKHHYPSLVKKALPFLARRPLVEVLERLPPQYYLAFCRFHEAWNEVFRKTIKATVNRLDGDPPVIVCSDSHFGMGGHRQCIRFLKTIGEGC